MDTEIVKTSFLTWRDPYAWTEKTNLFQRMAKRENAWFREAVAAAGKPADMASQFEKAQKDHAAALLGAYGKVVYKPNFEGGGGYLWRFHGSATWREAADLDIVGDTVIYTVETGTGKQSYTICARTPGRLLWKSSELAGPDVAIVGDRVYALEVDTPLRYNTLFCLDLKTGAKRKTLYHNPDDRWLLRLVKAGNGGLFLVREQASLQQCFWIRGETVERIAPEAVCVVPIGLVGDGEPLALIRQRSLNSPWRFSGTAPWKLPAAIADQGIEFATPDGILVTRKFGQRTLWNSDQPIRKFFGAIVPDPLGAWKGIPTTALWLIIPGSTLECIAVDGVVKVKGDRYGKTRHGEAISSDGFPVGWLIVSEPERKPGQFKGLMVVSYGGYGSPTPIGTARWKPWIDAGWAIGYAFVRGGGDSDEAWAARGRLGGKEQGLDDLEAVIVVLQELTGCSQATTCVFGRSAGGLMVGGIAGRHPNGGLVQKVYAEAPYVDLLKTASNPRIPLTPGEYEEFGNPAAGPAEFNQTLRSSPVHRLPESGAPGLTVVCRTGFFDINVYPYESLKWIMALRGGRPGPDRKWLSVGLEGHFAKGKSHYEELAEDFLLLNN